MSDGSDDLSRWRADIDAIDDEILQLLHKRAHCAQQIGALKAKHDAPVWRPEREAQILRKVVAAHTGSLPPASLTAIFKEIMSACRALESRLRVAFLGPEGTFTQQAMWQFFGHGIDPVAAESVESVFRQVEGGSCVYGVVPVENSTEGAVPATLDGLLHSPLLICGELSMPIDHFLLTASADKVMDQLTAVYGHPQALAQCRQYLQKTLPKVELRATRSTAEGARLALQHPGTAAIASQAAADEYSLVMLDQHIQDDPRNQTRFLCLGRQMPAPSGADRCSMILSVHNEPGAVVHLLEPLSRYGVSMTRLESRPARTGRWEYFFYVDIAGHEQDPQIASALVEVKQRAAFFKALGSYPRAVIG